MILGPVDLGERLKKRLRMQHAASIQPREKLGVDTAEKGPFGIDYLHTPDSSPTLDEKKHVCKLAECPAEQAEVLQAGLSALGISSPTSAQSEISYDPQRQENLLPILQMFAFFGGLALGCIEADFCM